MSVIQKYLYELNNNKTSKKQADYLKTVPLDNFQIENYDIPDSKVVIYKELVNYNTLEEVFGNYKIIFLLYQPLNGSMGHWVMVYKNGFDVEYFCSYGYRIDYPITGWYKDGQKLYLTRLLMKRNYNIVYNAYRFQSKNNASIASCGRWCILRARTIVDDRMTLPQFIDFLVALKSRIKERTYDNIVSDLIDIK